MVLMEREYWEEHIKRLQVFHACLLLLIFFGQYFFFFGQHRWVHCKMYKPYLSPLSSTKIRLTEEEYCWSTTICCVEMPSSFNFSLIVVPVGSWESKNRRKRGELQGKRNQKKEKGTQKKKKRKEKRRYLCLAMPTAPSELRGSVPKPSDSGSRHPRWSWSRPA